LPNNKPSTIVSRVAGVGVGLHFFFVLSVVTHLSDWHGDQPAAAPLNSAMAYYDALTFSNRNFGFFAPEVTGDCIVELTETDRHGRSSRRKMAAAQREMQIKQYAMVGAFLASDDSMDLFARSWALNAVNRNPDLVQVDLEVRQNVLPSMAEYRAGMRIRARLLYQTTFRLD
jgi:hypothetical protein